MPILTPEIASLYGALDSNAFDAEAAYSAHLLRVMAMTRNRLVSKGQALCSLTWPSFDTTESAGDFFSGWGPLRFTRIHPPIPVMVKPGLTTASVRMTMRTGSSHIINVQVSTLGRPFQSDRVDAVVSGTSWSDVDIDDIPLRPNRNGLEEFRIWVRGERLASLGSTANNGSPNTGTFETITQDWAADYGATWNTTASGSLNWANGGHTVSFEDSSGTEVIAPRSIISVSGADPSNPSTGKRLVFGEQLSTSEVGLATAAGGYFSIYVSPTFGISNFAAAADARSA